MNNLTVETTFGTIAFQQTRNEGFPMLFVHGNTLSAKTFNWQLKSTNFSEFNFIAFELPGQAKSDLAYGFVNAGRKSQGIIISFNKPFAVLHAGSDQLVSTDYFNDLPLNKLREEKIHLINDSGHSSLLENPDVFNELLLKFIKIGCPG